MAVVRRTRHAPLGAADFWQRSLQIVDPPVEIVGRAEEHDGARDALEALIVREGRAIERIYVGPIADPATGGRSGLHTGVCGRRQDGQLAAHGVAVDAEPLRIHLGLRFQKGQGAAGTERAEKPRIVPGRLHGVQGPPGRRECLEIIFLMAARRVVGVERSPIRRQPVGGISCFSGPEQRHTCRVDGVARRGDPPGPRDREGRVTALGVGEDGAVVGILSAAMNLNQSRKLGGACGKSIDGDHHRFLPFEDPDPVADHPQRNAIFLPSLQRLDVERLTPRIEAGPQFLEGVRRASVLERRQRLGLGTPEAHDQGEQERVDYFFRHDW